ncbi:hypothetical protein RM545_10235 [Zunongwangia sp. F260]|uniref:Tetratricopeptide repeat protein n=1 Tax=Autumnicola lenta TaxID=3075593 RepID=A0ABU3CL33_9FLAO|nr:hypothetical protein [Zunongwangia sp. F260]MDT0647070.1 hypothetical protein [Zunongwangia sp. F260]
MKNLLLIFILIFINSVLAQENEIDSLMAEGNTAFSASDFQTAKEKYASIIKIDSTKRDALFNLGATYLNLGDNTKACSLFQKAYSRGDIDSYDVIMQYCGKLEYSEKMFQWHVDESFKFEHEGQFEEVILNKKEINPDFIELLKSEIKKSKELKRIKEKVIITLNVDIGGNLKTKVGGKISPDQKQKLLEILHTMTEYKPATYQNRKVELFGGGYALPLIINN